jgi:DNA topoisomerase VI subunit B
MNDLNRTHFTTSRANEYFTAKDLQAQTGVAQKDFASSILKELADNALDAAESCKIDPELGIEVEKRVGQLTISISDNGPGLSAETLAKILDFLTRTSNKAHYRSPTRGAQGNALKTVFGMAHALGGKPVVVESMGVKHTIAAKITPANELVVDHDQEPIELGAGSKITVEVPGADWSNGRPTFQNFAPSHWARAFALFNPHVSVKFTLKTECDDEIEHR